MFRRIRAAREARRKIACAPHHLSSHLMRDIGLAPWPEAPRVLLMPHWWHAPK